ncbi:MAG: response regulator transcription factor [Chloroflexota bacterium]
MTADTNATASIMLVDDDPAFNRLVNEVLSHQGYHVLTAIDGQTALRLLFAQKPDLVLLDVVMPGMDGWQVCSRIRELSDVPIVMITGKKTTEADIVQGLDYGADEYLVKPVGNRELVARVRAVLRRAKMPATGGTGQGINYSDDYLTVDIGKRMVMANGEPVKLTSREFRLLACLVENAGRILSHQQLLEKVWGWEYSNDYDYIRIYVWHLRQKIEPEPTQPRYLITQPGVGYQFQPAAKLNRAPDEAGAR